MLGNHAYEAGASGRRRPSRHVSESGWAMALMTLQILMGFTALFCGGLLVFNGLGMSRSVLNESPFDSFLIPGITLAVIVGGSLLLSARLIWSRHHLAQLSSVIAGWILLGWIVIESLMVPEGRPLQAAIFLYAFVIINLGWRLFRSEVETGATDA